MNSFIFFTISFDFIDKQNIFIQFSDSVFYIMTNYNEVNDLPNVNAIDVMTHQSKENSVRNAVKNYIHNRTVHKV